MRLQSMIIGVLIIFQFSCDHNIFPASSDDPSQSAGGSGEILTGSSQEITVDIVENQEQSSTSLNVTTPAETETSQTTSAYKATYYGIYGSRIKSSSSENSTEGSTNDITEMVTALQTLGVKVFGYSAQDGDDDQPCFLTDETGASVENYTAAGTEWCHFLELLEATKDTGIKIFLYVAERHLGSGTNRWLTASSSSYADQSKDAHDLWLESWQIMAKDVSALKAQYPHLIGVNLDDFGAYVCGNDNHYNELTSEEWCYTKDEVQSITTAAKTTSDLQIWPTLYFEACTARLINQSYVLGSPRTVKRNAGDYAALKFTINLDTIPTEARLSYFLRDTNIRNLCDEGSSGTCDLTTCESVVSAYHACMIDGGYSSAKGTACESVYNDVVTQASLCSIGVGSMVFAESLTINANTIYNRHLVGDDYIDQYDLNITSYLNPITDGSSQNEITFKVHYLTTKNGFQEALVYISNLKLTVDGEELACSETSETCTVSYEKSSVNIGYAADSGTTYLYTEVFSDDNEDYRIVDSIDGAFSPYRSDAADYDETYYEDLLQSTKEVLGSKGLYVINYAGMWGVDTDSTTLSKQVEAAMKQADASLLISYELGMMAPGKGIFSFRDSWHSDFNMMSFWPSSQPGLEGYYQKYTTKESFSGAVTVTLQDSRGTSFSTSKYFLKKIYDANGTVYYENYVGNANGYEETVTIDLGTTPTKLTFEVTEISLVGSSSFTTYFDVDVTGTDGIARSLTKNDFDFESWTSYTQTLDIHDMMQTIFSTYR